MNNKTKFSAKERKEVINKLQSKEFDLVIIGGGITGAGIALDASSRGLSVALVEKNDFASGTSSRSTKLVHGGLRYLEHLELGIVKEVGREREIVHNNASHIVLPEKMLLPIIKDGNLGEFTTSLALYVYDFLAGVKKEEHRKMLSREKTIEKEPLIESDLLKSGAVYYEYKTDDSRLTIEVMKKAVEYGSLATNYCNVESYIYDNDKKVTGINVTNTIDNEQFEIKGKYIVNATGVWVDKMRDKDNSLKGKRLHITKGVHIVVPKVKFNLNHALYFDVGDKRMVFAIPRFEVVYIGTTDTNYTGDYENPTVTKQDAQYLLDAMNRIAPTAKLQLSDIESAWSGLRPLIHEDGKDPSELSRKDEIFYSDSGLLSIAGGKLTGYRIMAMKVVDIIAKKMDKDIGKCVTKNIKLAGGEFDFEYSLRNLVEYADKKYDEAKHGNISVEDFKKLFYRYGTNVEMVTNLAFDFYNKTKDWKLAWLKAEVNYCVDYEMVTSLTDFFIRRTGMIHFYINDIEKIKNTVANELQMIFNLSDNQKNMQIEELERELKAAKSFLD